MTDIEKLAQWHEHQTVTWGDVAEMRGFHDKSARTLRLLADAQRVAGVSVEQCQRVREQLVKFTHAQTEEIRILASTLLPFIDAALSGIAARAELAGEQERATQAEKQWFQHSADREHWVTQYQIEKREHDTALRERDAARAELAQAQQTVKNLLLSSPESDKATIVNLTAKCRILQEQLAALKRPGWVMAQFIDTNSASFGNGTEYEEHLINAGTKYITSTIGFYPTGDRRFTIGLFNSMLAACKKST